MRTRGYTLVEVVVAGAVSLLIMTAVMQLFLAGGRIFARSQARADLQAAGVVGLNRLMVELQRASMDSLTIATTSSTQPEALAFRVEDYHRAQPLLFTPSWSFVVYAFDAQRGALVRKTWPTTTDVSLGTDPLVMNRRLTPEELGGICGRVNGTERVVASRVVDMTVSPPTFPSMSPEPVISVTLALRHELSSTETLQSTVSDGVAMRNHR